MSVNHFKSKGSACDDPDELDGQGNCNQVRVHSANLLTAWLETDPTGTGSPDVLIIGDLNSYAKEDPITAIKNSGYTDLIDAFQGGQAYSYCFDSQWGYLYHALGSASLTSRITGVAPYHINADEPSVLDYNMEFKTANQLISLYQPNEFRTADHDPILIGLNLIHHFAGFFPPIDNPPVLNKVKAGSAVPVKFSLTGNQGLDIFAAGYPQSAQVPCQTRPFR